MSEEADARALFKSFHHRDPSESKAELVRVSKLATPVIALEVGKLISIGYRAAGDRKDYYHEFDREGDPRVYVRYDGRQIFILGGVYRFTSRGFVR